MAEKEDFPQPEVLIGRRGKGKDHLLVQKRGTLAPHHGQHHQSMEKGRAGCLPHLGNLLPLHSQRAEEGGTLALFSIRSIDFFWGPNREKVGFRKRGDVCVISGFEGGKALIPLMLKEGRKVGVEIRVRISDSRQFIVDRREKS